MTLKEAIREAIDGALGKAKEEVLTIILSNAELWKAFDECIQREMDEQTSCVLHFDTGEPKAWIGFGYDADDPLIETDIQLPDFEGGFPDDPGQIERSITAIDDLIEQFQNTKKILLERLQEPLERTKVGTGESS